MKKSEELLKSLTSLLEDDEDNLEDNVEDTENEEVKEEDDVEEDSELMDDESSEDEEDLGDFDLNLDDENEDPDEIESPEESEEVEDGDVSATSSDVMSIIEKSLESGNKVNITITSEGKVITSPANKTKKKAPVSKKKINKKLENSIKKNKKDISSIKNKIKSKKALNEKEEIIYNNLKKMGTKCKSVLTENTYNFISPLFSRKGSSMKNEKLLKTLVEVLSNYTSNDESDVLLEGYSPKKEKVISLSEHQKELNNIKSEFETYKLEQSLNEAEIIADKEIQKLNFDSYLKNKIKETRILAENETSLMSLAESLDNELLTSCVKSLDEDISRLEYVSLLEDALLELKTINENNSEAIKNKNIIPLLEAEISGDIDGQLDPKMLPKSSEQNLAPGYIKNKFDDTSIPKSQFSDNQEGYETKLDNLDLPITKHIDTSSISMKSLISDISEACLLENEKFNHKKANAAFLYRKTVSPKSINDFAIPLVVVSEDKKSFEISPNLVENAASILINEDRMNVYNIPTDKIFELRNKILPYLKACSLDIPWNED